MNSSVPHKDNAETPSVNENFAPQRQSRDGMIRLNTYNMHYNDFPLGLCSCMRMIHYTHAKHPSSGRRQKIPSIAAGSKLEYRGIFSLRCLLDRAILSVIFLPRTHTQHTHSVYRATWREKCFLWYLPTTALK